MARTEEPERLDRLMGNLAKKLREQEELNREVSELKAEVAAFFPGRQPRRVFKLRYYDRYNTIDDFLAIESNPKDGFRAERFPVEDPAAVEPPKAETEPVPAEAGPALDAAIAPPAEWGKDYRSDRDLVVNAQS